jgi:hypothetical protein
VIKLPEVLQIKKSKNPIRKLFGGKKSKVSSSFIVTSEKKFNEELKDSKVMRQDYDILRPLDWHQDDFEQKSQR